MQKRIVLFVVIWGLFAIAYVGVRIVWFPPAPPPPQEVSKPKEAPPQAQPLDGLLAVIESVPAQIDWLLVAEPTIAERINAKLAEARNQEEARARDEEIVLGDVTNYKLLVGLSKYGAAVRTITLNQYQEAGAGDAKPTGRPLVLVNDNLDGKLVGAPLQERLQQQSFRLLADENVPIDWEYLPPKETDQDERGRLKRAVFVGTPRGKNLKVLKTFTLEPGQYHVGMQLQFQATGPGKAELVYTLTGPRGVPVEGQIWKTSPFRQIVIGTVNAKSGSGATRYLVDVQQIRDKEVKNSTIKLPILAGPEAAEAVQYTGVMVQYFAALAVVDGNPEGMNYIDQITPENLGNDSDPIVEHQVMAIPQKLQGRITANLRSRPLQVTEAKPITHRYLLYAGPTKVKLLDDESGIEPGLVEKYASGLHLNMMTDYPSYRWTGWGWSQLVVMITDIMHWLLYNLAWLTGGRYWAAIILLTIIVRIIMFPVSRKQALTNIRMQKLAPELRKLQEKFKEDRQGMAQAQMELYRKHGVNPLSGCLIVLLQMPVFMGLYYAIYESVHLRLASFLWIENLAAPDMLFFWGPVGGFVNVGPYFNILPVVSIILMYLQQKLLMPPPADEQQAVQQKMMNIMMIFFAYMFYWVASGLCVYFTISSAWGIIERRLLPKVTHETSTTAALKASTVSDRSRAKAVKNGQTNGLLGRLLHWWNDLLEQAKKK